MVTFRAKLSMKNTIIVLLLGIQLCTASKPFWGKTGHRVTGEIAQKHLSRKARKAVNKILAGQTLAQVANFADDIRSDTVYRYLDPWHYVNYPGDMDYGQVEPDPAGDIVVAIQKCITILEDDNSSTEDKAFYLKLLVHFLGDLHQPMHVGKKEDRGGNDIQIQWFNEGSNLHRLWDSDMIDHYGMSYTELANKLTNYSKKEIRVIQRGSVLTWVEETQEITNEVYQSVQVGSEVGYGYSYKYWEMVEQQLLTGGLRLAAVLNSIFD